jgi:putative DNA methylase
MPGPAWRALLFAALIDDPGEDSERERLLTLMRVLVSSEAAIRDKALRAARQELAHQFSGSLPLVADPFCGGGSTLVEAQRLGLRSFGSDLNPIATLISKCLTEFPPALAHHAPVNTEARLVSGGPGLVGFKNDVRHYARHIYEEAQDRIGGVYPAGPNGDRVIAYRWARTVRSPDPSLQGLRVPLVADWWLSKKSGELAWIGPVARREEGRVTFTIEREGEPDLRPTGGDGGYCFVSGTPISFEYLRDEGKEGRLGLSLMAIATHGTQGRHYFSPREEDIASAEITEPMSMPEVDLPQRGLGFRVQAYGIRQWWQLFTPRQNLALGTFADLVAQVPAWATADGADDAYAAAVASVLGLCIGKLAQTNSTIVLWRTREGPSKAESAFSRNDIPPTWDFAETNPFGGSVGDWMQSVETALRAFDEIDWQGPAAVVKQADARYLDRHVDEPALIATDPPYFHYIGYGDLSNYFYVWIRRALSRVHPNLFSTLLAPTTGELIADPSRHEGDMEAAKSYFVDGFRETFRNMASVTRPDLPLLIVYAFKQQEARRDGQSSTGWEAMLQALLDAELGVVGTWPIHGTGSTRQRSQSSNTLATYILLVCRPRSTEAKLATRREFQVALRDDLRASLPPLISAGIAAVDLAQAAIGPGMAVFSGYARVLEADGSSMSVRTALQLINQVLDEILTEQESEYDAATRWSITWFDQYGTDDGPFGVAETLSKAKNTSVDSLRSDGFLSSGGGIVRLLKREELPSDWDPLSERNLSVWGVTQHVIKRLEEGGETAAASLVRRVGSLGDAARDLAYRLYATCERRNWTREGLAYNSLVVAWPEISRLAEEPLLEAQPTLGV